MGVIKLSSNDISMRIYRRRGEVVLAACDRELLGQKFEDGDMQLHVSKSFYYESYVSEQTFLNSMKIATIANLTGKRVIEIATKAGYIDADSVIRIAGIPHAQMVIMQ